MSAAMRDVCTRATRLHALGRLVAAAVAHAAVLLGRGRLVCGSAHLSFGYWPGVRYWGRGGQGGLLAVSGAGGWATD